MSKGCVYYDADANRCDYHDPISFKLEAENRQLRKENDTLCRRIDELCMEVGRLRRTAKRIVVSNKQTDHATGHTECSECGGTVNPFARYCEHCGAEFEEDT